MYKFIIILTLLLAPCSGISLCAQHKAKTQQGGSTTTEILNKASQLYNIGQFEECMALLKEHEREFIGQQRVQAYRMMSLISMYLDNNEDSERYASNLLLHDPFYTAYNENPRFRDLIERLKKGGSTISTASQQSESLNETPVPVTLITRQMIDMSGARTLQELLCLYVPGISIIDGMETNFAMRGVYSQNQESVLIMLDGHRLNSQSTNTEAPDFRTSLDKIQQIEVLRGPASSLYGNVALTAVVNIITRRGTELDGHSFTLGGGSFKSVGGTYMYGKGNLSQDIVAWASVYNSLGEKVEYPAIVTVIGSNAAGQTEPQHIPNGTDTRYIGAFNRKPAFDFGIRCKWDDISILFSAQHSKRAPFYNQLAAGDNYNYSDYKAYRGSSPGTSRTQYMAAVDYNHSWENLSVKLSGYGMIENTQLYNVLADSLDFFLGGILDLVIKGQTNLIESAMATGDYSQLTDAIMHSKINTHGVWEALDWESKTFGGTAQVGYNYILGKQRGNILAGVQYDYFRMTEGSFVMGGNYKDVSETMTEAIQTGDERTSSAFVQIKHNFADEFIFNGGFRVDHKERILKETLNSFSPRATIIWQPSQNRYWKLGYAHSFVDAPYLYRASNISLYKGVDLKAERLDAFQLSTIATWPQSNIRHEANVFLNRVKNLVYMNANGLNSDTSAGTMINSGSINMLGFENVIEYTTNRTIINTNLTWQTPTSVNGYPNVKGHVCNVPKLLFNITAAHNLYSGDRIGAIWLRGNMRYQSATEMLNVDILTSFANASKLDLNHATNAQLYPTEHQSGKCLVNMGADWKWNNIKLSIDCYNLLNTKYKAGGLLQGAVPQMSRCFIGKINITL